MAGQLESFRVVKVALFLRAVDAVRLPRNAGSTIRGGLGHALSELGCRAARSGGGCGPHQPCPYHQAFAPPVPPGSRILARVGTLPRPFVIEPPSAPLHEDEPAEGTFDFDPRESAFVFEPGELFPVGLVLVGQAIQYLPDFLGAFEALGRRGLGRGLGRYTLDAAQLVPFARAESRPDTAAGSMRVHFVSPTLLRFNGGEETPREFHIFFRSLARRINFLNYFHCGGELRDDALALIEASTGVRTLGDHLRPSRWTRFSRRQHQRVPMAGVDGWVHYHGDFAPFWPWLELGELVHVGEHTAFGLGQFVIDPEVSIPSEPGRRSESGEGAVRARPSRRS